VADRASLKIPMSHSSQHHHHWFTAAVITVSDSAATGTRFDRSGPAVLKLLEERHFHVVGSEIVPDEQAQIENALVRWSQQARLVVTTGGTGIAERDITPEATAAVCHRQVEGLAERMRAENMKRTPFAALSRSVCGIRGKTLIVNLPGSPDGATESLESVIDVLPHALELLDGKTEHAGRH
jgi:molybdenum cofactor synthesis domain-containing protein